MNKYRWGIIGTGRICTKFCYALKTIENAEIAAVCSRSADKGTSFAAQFGDSIAVCTDIEELCSRDDIDIVYIGTPHPYHINAALAAISKGKNVLCEKPFSLNARQARAAYDAAQDKCVFLMEAMWTRFLPAVLKVEEWINSGTIGEIREVHSDYRRYFPDEDPSSRLYNPSLGGGSMLDLGVYPLFAAQFGMGMGCTPEVAHSDVVYSQSGIDKEGTATLKYPGGRRAFVSFGFDSCTANATFIGTDGYIVVPNWCYCHSAYLFKNGQLADSFCEPESNSMRWEALEVMSYLDRGLTKSPRYTMDDTIRLLSICDELRNQWNITYPGDDASAIDSGAEVHRAPRRLNTAPDWYKDAVVYHIYPFGMCGVPEYNDFVSEPVDRLGEIEKLISHIDKLGMNAVYFGPVFESSKHGYDTANYGLIDRRLGTNAQFAHLCTELHARGIRVILDGVFNHVGRDFWAFKDVREHGRESRYAGWFNISFEGNSCYNDGFWYEGWEGHFELVKLNLRNPEVREHIFTNIREWIKQFDIDGLRLDVAYLLDMDFLHSLHTVCKKAKPDFFLMGECIHGDYNRIVNDSLLDSCTNYECYKGIHSSINGANMHEIGYSLHRQFGPEQWCLYRGKSLYTFIDNHDVSRIASVLSDIDLLPCAYALMFCMPGIPSVYYGSELGMRADKSNGDAALRPAMTADDARNMRGALYEYISRLSAARAHSKALCRGDYHQLYVQPRQLIFDRCYEDERVICAINTSGEAHIAHFDAHAGRMLDLLSGQSIDFGGGLVIPPKTAYIGRVY